jgi:hypothetical protein
VSNKSGQLQYIHGVATPHQTKHELTVAASAAWAIELACGGTCEAGDAEIDRAIELAPSGVRSLLLRLPNPRPGKTRLAALSGRLDEGLRRSLPGRER